MSKEIVNTFIKMVIEENLVQAQTTLKEYLNDKLTNVLQEKYEEYAPTIFEKWDAELADKNKDGKVSSWEEKSTKWAKEGEETNDDEATDEEQSDSEEEDGAEDESGDESDEEAEEENEEEED
jgi:hypothetical protein